MVEYAFIAVEGNHDQAFIGKILKLLGFKDFNETDGGLNQKLDLFWKKLVPSYPTNKGELYKRLPMPSILYTDTLSVAIYNGEGKKLRQTLEGILTNNPNYQTDLSSFIVIVDADNNEINDVINPYVDCFQSYFPNFPRQAGIVNQNSFPFTGIYVLPDNRSKGRLDHLLYLCGTIAYSEYVNICKSSKRLFSNFYSRRSRKLKME